MNGTLKPAHIVLILIVVLGVGFFGMKHLGLHFDGIKVVRGGSLIIATDVIVDDIFLDNKRITTSDLLNVKPGTREVIISQEGFWPWKKEIDVESDTETPIFPFSVSKNVSGTLITQSDPDYGRLSRAVRNTARPNENNPVTSSSTNVSAWLSGNTIVAKWNDETKSVPEYFCEEECTTTITVFESTVDIRSLAFFKDRDDILLVASRDGVFALEIDKRGTTQNFQPVYRGTSGPIFTILDGQVYVLDGALLFSVAI